MPTVRTNGIETYYEEYGDGPPIVFLHGGTMDLRLWAKQVQPLADEYRIIVYDIRGHGKTGGSDQPRYSIELFTEDLRAFCETLNLTRPVICGLSLGGMIGFRYALQHPDDLSATIMIGALTPETFSWSERFWRRDSYVLADFAATVVERERVMGAMHWLYRHVGDSGDIGDVEKASEIASDHAEAYPETSGAEHEKLQRGWTEYLTLSPDYTELDVPVLFLYGEREQDLVARHAGFIERDVPNGQQQEIPDAGHFSHVDNPEYVVESIREFLSTLEGFEDKSA